MKFILFFSLLVFISTSNTNYEEVEFLAALPMLDNFEEAKLSSEIENVENVEIVEETHKNLQVAKDQEFSDFLNALLGSTLGYSLLNKCSRPYNPDTNSHEIFITQFQKVSTSANGLITKKSPKEINGEICKYNTADPNVYISAKKAEITTQSFFAQLIFKTAFGTTFIEFSKCIGVTELNKIADPVLVDELFFLFGNDKMGKRLWESFCTINNIFSQMKISVDAKDAGVYKKMGEALKNVLMQVNLHYLNLKK
jgi:hypothetical protein